MKIIVKAKPGAKIDSVVKSDSPEGEVVYIVSVKEKPVMGKANQAICRALAEHFGVPNHCVQILAGEHSKRKIIEITNLDTKKNKNQKTK